MKPRQHIGVLARVLLAAAPLFAFTACGGSGSGPDLNAPLPGALETMNVTIAGTARSALIYTPSRLAAKGGINISTIIALRNDASAGTLNSYLRGSGLLDIAEQQDVLVVLPNPGAKGWDATTTADVDFVSEEVGNFTATYTKGQLRDPNDPTSALINAGSGSGPARYLLADGSAAAVAQAVAMRDPQKVTAMLTFGSATPPASYLALPKVEVPSWNVNGATALTDFWRQANKTAATPTTDARLGAGNTIYRNPTTLAMQVVLSTTGNGDKLDAPTVTLAWNQFLDKTRRFNWYGTGVISYKPSLEESGLIQVEGVSFNDGNGPHGWLEGLPGPLQAGKKYPLVIVNPGSSSTPLYFSEQAPWHTLGKQEGFITIYPWSNDRLNWFEEPNRTTNNDVKYMVALVDHLKAKYPVDTTRIYFTGHSAGSLMARTMGALYPEWIAAVAPFDANTCPGCAITPGVAANTIVNTSVAEAVAAKKAAGRAKGINYRMPVWMLYGTKDREFKTPTTPVLATSAQRALIDFWRDYNNVTKYPYDISKGDLIGIGAPGEATLVKSEPDANYPTGRFTTYQFATNDNPSTNLVNYTLVQDQPHAVDLRAIPQAWKFMQRFSRNPDGTLVIR